MSFVKSGLMLGRVNVSHWLTKDLANSSHHMVELLSKMILLSYVICMNMLNGPIVDSNDQC